MQERITVSSHGSMVRCHMAYIPRLLDRTTTSGIGIGAGWARDLTLEVSEKQCLVHSYNPNTKTIRVSTRVLEVLWAQTYAYYMFYIRMCQGTMPDGKIVEPASDPALQQALALLSWASKSLVGSNEEVWPIGCPDPCTVIGDVGAHRNVTTIALYGLEFLLLHELAHHVLRHSAGGGDVLEQEKEADRQASEWMMQCGTKAEPEWHMRVLGSSVSLLYMNVRGVYTGSHGGATHPKDYSRLSVALKAHVHKDHVAWAFVATMLSLHMQDSGRVVRQVSYGTFFDWCDDLIDELSRDVGR